MEANRVKVAKLGREAIENRRMPKAQSDSSELLAIAEKAIAAASEEWKIGKIVRMVINYDKQHKKKVWHNGVDVELLEWDEFQVTVAEKDGDEFHYRTCMIKRYQVGGNGKWSVVKSMRWGIILEKNIFK